MSESSGARKGWAEFISEAVEDGRVLSYDKEKGSVLSVIAQHARLGDITEASLNDSIAQIFGLVNSKDLLYEMYMGDQSYYVVQAVPDTQAKTLFIVSTFIGDQGYSGKIKKVGQAKVNSLKIRGSTPHSNFNNSIPQNTEMSTPSEEKYDLADDATYTAAVESGDMDAAQRMVDAAAKQIKTKKSNPIGLDFWS